jgi:thiol-disulfide isomerase/thioredoxin
MFSPFARLILVFLLACCAACGKSDPTLRARESLANFRPFDFNFELPDLDGKKVALADFKGKVVIVDLWATWCLPCRDEIPHFVELYHKYQRAGLEIVGVNYETAPGNEAQETIRSFVSKHGIPYPCVIGDSKTKGMIPGFKGFPTTLFIDRSGAVRLTLTGYTPPKELEAIVTVLLEEPG